MSDGMTPDELPQPEYEGMAPIDDLSVDKENPNEMSDEQFGLLKDRMRQNGWLGGPIITDTDGLIADGEHRWRAADAIGLDEVPVRQYDIDDATRRLWRQELNKIHGEHDSKRDALEYDYLLDAGKADEVHELTQAADEDLDELLAQIKMETSASPAYEYDPEHNVYFEDCVEGMRERLDDDSVHMVFTSPPYNVGLKQANKRTSKTTEYGDEMEFEEYKQFLRDVFSELSRVVSDHGHIFVNYGVALDNASGIPPESTWLPSLFPSEVSLSSYIIWHKEDTIPSHSLHHNQNGLFIHDWESIFHFTIGEPREIDHDYRSVWSVNTVEANSEDRGEYGSHPAAFPIELPRRAIKSTTEPGDAVLDPFMGTGTTAVAAIQNNRDYVGFELDEEGAYKPIIERRIGEAKRQRDAGVNEVGADD